MLSSFLQKKPLWRTCWLRVRACFAVAFNTVLIRHIFPSIVNINAIGKPPVISTLSVFLIVLDVTKQDSRCSIALQHL